MANPFLFDAPAGQAPQDNPFLAQAPGMAAAAQMQQQQHMAAAAVPGQVANPFMDAQAAPHVQQVQYNAFGQPIAMAAAPQPPPVAAAQANPFADYGAPAPAAAAAMAPPAATRAALFGVPQPADQSKAAHTGHGQYTQVTANQYGQTVVTTASVAHQSVEAPAVAANAFGVPAAPTATSSVHGQMLVTTATVAQSSTAEVSRQPPTTLQTAAAPASDNPFLAQESAPADSTGPVEEKEEPPPPPPPAEAEAQAVVTEVPKVEESVPVPPEPEESTSEVPLPPPPAAELSRQDSLPPPPPKAEEETVQDQSTLLDLTEPAPPPPPEEEQPQAEPEPAPPEPDSTTEIAEPVAETAAPPADDVTPQPKPEVDAGPSTGASLFGLPAEPQIKDGEGEAGEEENAVEQPKMTTGDAIFSDLPTADAKSTGASIFGLSEESAAGSTGATLFDVSAPKAAQPALGSMSGWDDAFDQQFEAADGAAAGSDPFDPFSGGGPAAAGLVPGAGFGDSAFNPAAPNNTPGIPRRDMVAADMNNPFTAEVGFGDEKPFVPEPAAGGGDDENDEILFDDDTSKPLEAFPRIHEKPDGWEFFIRYPNKKKLTAQR